MADLDFNDWGDGDEPDRSYERPVWPAHLLIFLAHMAALLGAAVLVSVLK
jgi:hypothetical protein